LSKLTNEEIVASIGLDGSGKVEHWTVHCALLEKEMTKNKYNAVSKNTNKVVKTFTHQCLIW
jgi:hypothetical protein